LCKFRLQKGLSGNQHQVATGGQCRDFGADGLAQQAFGAITLDSASERTARGNPYPQAWFTRNQCNQHNKRVRERLARNPHPLEIGGPGQSKATLHPSLTFGNGERRCGLPAHFLNVIVASDR
jgi:hypothetical protein